MKLGIPPKEASNKCGCSNCKSPSDDDETKNLPNEQAAFDRALKTLAGA